MNERAVAQWYQLQPESELRKILAGIPNITQYGCIVAYHLLPETAKQKIRATYKGGESWPPEEGL